MNKIHIKNNLKTKFIGQDIVVLDIIDSTQDEIKRRDNLENGTVIIAENQTKGKGTHGRVWYTDTSGKNIAMTFVLYPNTHISKFEDITVIIARCIVKTFKKLYNINLDIKYPNDIVINSKKIGGILTETKVIGQNVKELYIGIGLNILQKGFRENIKDIASSIINEFNIKCIREDIISEFFNIFEYEYLKLLEGQYEQNKKKNI